VLRSLASAARPVLLLLELGQYLQVRHTGGYPRAPGLSLIETQIHAGDGLRRALIPAGGRPPPEWLAVLAL
jgi:hypothetical protein